MEGRRSIILEVDEASCVRYGYQFHGITIIDGEQYLWDDTKYSWFRTVFTRETNPGFWDYKWAEARDPDTDEPDILLPENRTAYEVFPVEKTIVKYE